MSLIRHIVTAYNIAEDRKNAEFQKSANYITKNAIDYIIFAFIYFINVVSRLFNDTRSLHDRNGNDKKLMDIVQKVVSRAGMWDNTQVVFMPLPTIVGECIMFSGCPSGSPSVVRPLTPISLHAISLYLVEGCQWNLSQIFILWVEIAEKVYKVRLKGRDHTVWVKK